MGQDNYVRVASSDYSVDPTVIGGIVDVMADQGRVTVRLDGRIVADHARIWARGVTITDPVRVEIAKGLREQFQRPDRPPARMT